MFYKNCIECNCVMYRKKRSEATRKNWLYCSRSCHTKRINKNKALKYKVKTEKFCLICKKQFSVTQHVRQQKKQFCSRMCCSKNALNAIKNLPDERKKELNRMLAIRAKKTFTGYKWSEERRRHHSEMLKGSKSHFWKGGVTKENKIIRASLIYSLWRENVFKRDNWTCIWCLKRSSKNNRVELHADHIKPFAYFPELRFDINNGRTLCVDCHKKTETYLNNSACKKVKIK